MFGARDSNQRYDIFNSVAFAKKQNYVPKCAHHISSR